MFAEDEQNEDEAGRVFHCGPDWEQGTGPTDGTLVRLRPGMPGTRDGQLATLRLAHPGGAARPGLVWLECEVVWSHGTAEGFWAGAGEYDEVL